MGRGIGFCPRGGVGIKRNGVAYCHSVVFVVKVPRFAVVLQCRGEKGGGLIAVDRG